MGIQTPWLGETELLPGKSLRDESLLLLTSSGTFGEVFHAFCQQEHRDIGAFFASSGLVGLN